MHMLGCTYYRKSEGSSGKGQYTFVICLFRAQIRCGKSKRSRASHQEIKRMDGMMRVILLRIYYQRAMASNFWVVFCSLDILLVCTKLIRCHYFHLHYGLYDSWMRKPFVCSYIDR